jgi:hypothetical protein
MVTGPGLVLFFLKFNSFIRYKLFLAVCSSETSNPIDHDAVIIASDAQLEIMMPVHKLEYAWNNDNLPVNFKLNTSMQTYLRLAPRIWIILVSLTRRRITRMQKLGTVTRTRMVFTHRDWRHPTESPPRMPVGNSVTLSSSWT